MLSDPRSRADSAINGTYAGKNYFATMRAGRPPMQYRLRNAAGTCGNQFLSSTSKTVK